MKGKLSISRKIFVWVIGLLLFLSVDSVFAAKPIELRFAIHSPPGSLIYNISEAWKNKLEKETNGEVLITIYPAQSLVKLKDAYTGTVKGITDIAFVAPDMDASRFSLNMIIELPLLGLPKGIAPTKIWADLQEKFPAMKDEFKETKLLWQYAALPLTLHLTKASVRVPDDIKGLKIEAGGLKAAPVKYYGASPMVMPPPEWYNALDRSIEDGMIHNFAPIFVFKTHTLLKHHVDADFGTLAQFFVMNKRKWDQLPKHIQQKMDEIRPWIEQQSVDMSDALDTKVQKMCKDLGHEFVTLTPEEKELWQKGAPSAYDYWAEKAQGKGVDPREIINEAKTLAQKYQ